MNLPEHLSIVDAQDRKLEVSLFLDEDGVACIQIDTHDEDIPEVIVALNDGYIWDQGEIRR
jgi:hypothetical protein